MKPARTIGALLAAAALATISLSAARVGDAAPDFSGKDTKGASHKLADFKGKWVVLEWHNQGCPFVKKQYDSGNMQKLQKQYTAKGVVWLTVISSAAGQQGYVTGGQADALRRPAEGLADRGAPRSHGCHRQGV